MTNKLQVIIIMLLIPLGGLFLYTEHANVTVKELFFSDSTVMHIGDIPLNVEVSDSDEERRQGLSNRPELGPVDGMLFIFDETAYHGVWMKDMSFPIDVIWIGEDLKVIGVTEFLRPDSFPQVFEPPSPARYAIETNVHFADSFGIRVGDQVVLPIKYREQ